jgi:hypothetical protein
MIDLALPVSMRVSDWLALINSSASLATVVIAFVALKSWKRQDRANREAEFLDQVIDATHNYVTRLPRAVELLRYARIGIISHAPMHDANAEPTIDGAIAYIAKRGSNVGDQLRQALSDIQPSVVRLRSLGDKGQIFRFPEYAKCVNGIAQITWHFDRLGAFLTTIESPSWNWENPAVLSMLENVLKIDPTNIQQGLADQHKEILIFLRKTYETLYK